MLEHPDKVGFQTGGMRPPATAAGPKPDASLTAIAGTAFADAFAALSAAEQTSAAAIQGHVPVQAMVEKVLEAERQFQAVIAIRDKIVSAYLELNRMSI
jgi:flagellar hook-basal body complex protein FliE